MQEKIPRMLEDDLKTNYFEPWTKPYREMTEKEIVDIAEELVNYVLSDWWTFITNDENGYTEEEFKELKEFVENKKKDMR